MYISLVDLLWGNEPSHYSTDKIRGYQCKRSPLAVVDPTGTRQGVSIRDAIHGFARMLRGGIYRIHKMA